MWNTLHPFWNLFKHRKKEEIKLKTKIKADKYKLLELLLNNQDNMTLIEMRKGIKELNFNKTEERVLLNLF